MAHAPDNSRNDFLIEVADTLAGAPAWAELETSGVCTAFQTQAWLRPWFDVIAPAFGASPLFVTVRDRASGRPLMVLPLSLRRAAGARRIEFPDLGVSDYNAPLMAKGFVLADEAWALLWKQIVRALPPADLIVFEKLPETVEGQPNPLFHLKGAEVMRVRCWDLELPASREIYDKGLKAEVRKELRRKRKNLEMEGPVRLVTAAAASEGREIFDVHQRQRRIRGTPIGQDPSTAETFIAFYDAAFVGNVEAGFCIMQKLMVGDEIGATMIGLHHHDVRLLLMHCFETGRWGKKSPGIVAIDAALTDQMEAGTRLYDFTIGNEPYKLQFGVQEHILLGYQEPLSPLGMALIGFRRVRRFFGDQIRKVPRKYLPRRFRE